jgi:hypothetical protein
MQIMLMESREDHHPLHLAAKVHFLEETHFLEEDLLQDVLKSMYSIMILHQQHDSNNI